MRKLDIDVQKQCLRINFILKLIKIDFLKSSPLIGSKNAYSLPEMMFDSLNRCETEL